MRFLFISLFLICIQPAYSLEKVNMVLYNYAKACPAGSTQNMQTLVSYLSKGGKTQSQRVELFCYWITENIAYDTQALITGKFSTGNILATKKGVCQGYSELLRDMCKLSGIESHVIIGYSKWYDYTKNQVPQNTDHAWNVVKVDGKYVHIDVTWASGYVKTINGKPVFVKALNVAELFAEPSYFLTKHLPGDPMWQLRNNPITLKGFTGNDSINDMLKFTLPNYTFQDSLNVYLKADSMDRQVIYALNTYNFNPVKANLSFLGDTYYNKAWYLSNYIKTITAYETAIVWYDKSIVIYNKLNNSYSSKWIANAKQGIAHCNFKIKVLKEPQ